jgi:hypothetical protein
MATIQPVLQRQHLALFRVRTTSPPSQCRQTQARKIQTISQFRGSMTASTPRLEYSIGAGTSTPNTRNAFTVYIENGAPIEST